MFFSLSLNRNVQFSLGRIEILVFVVVQHSQLLHANIIVVHVEKHFAQLVSILNPRFDRSYQFFDKGSSKSSPILEFGIEDEVRVCESCYDRLTT